MSEARRELHFYSPSTDSLNAERGSPDDIAVSILDDPRLPFIAARVDEPIIIMLSVARTAGTKEQVMFAAGMAIGQVTPLVKFIVESIADVR